MFFKKNYFAIFEASIKRRLINDTFSRIFNNEKMNEEIKEWQTQSVKHKVAYVLMMDGISFRYTEETGIVFSAPDFYVKNLIRRLMSCYGVSLKPIINEFK